ncbi:hypothetical protein BS47DRAFT_1365310 [Hydnum rufescens UP504]|uniref:Uncharacterized protein n=1 Tax=Hydnum rufescens UP504 TaxID=1448309 RepID=A0A9P6ANY8_9AGAM|nr:hypothetical protein BS47DRAFT_1365310 [Hydnum rufescens UP504]
MPNETAPNETYRMTTQHEENGRGGHARTEWPHEPHTRCGGCVAIYNAIATNKDLWGKPPPPPASETRERRHEMTPNRMNHTPAVAGYHLSHPPNETRKRQCTHQPRATNATCQGTSARRNPGTGTHDARPQGPQTNHARWVCGIGFHLNPHPHQPPIKICDPAEQIRENGNKSKIRHQTTETLDKPHTR